MADTIFWETNFQLYPGHTLNLAKKLDLKIKSLKADRVKGILGKI